MLETELGEQLGINKFGPRRVLFKRVTTHFEPSTAAASGREHSRDVPDEPMRMSSVATVSLRELHPTSGVANAVWDKAVSSSKTLQPCSPTVGVPRNVWHCRSVHA
eukprot:1205055-Pyramimonas_sp.AAC.1